MPIPLRRFRPSRLLLLLACGLAAGESPAFGQTAETKINPLFPVRLEHEFPNPQATFEEVKKLILENYYSGEVGEAELYWAAIQGMLRQISPPDNPELAKIWTAEEYEKILQSLEGVDVSLGLKSSFNAGDGSLTVSEIMPNSPAEGVVQPLDRILRIDGQPLKGRPVAEVNRLLAGAEGSSVTLTVSRDIKVFDLTLQRQKFHTQNLYRHALTDRIGLIELRTFSSDISAELATALRALQEEGRTALVLDLRNNSGGVFGEALKISNLFVKDKGIVLRTFNQQSKLQNYVSDNAAPCEFKLAVLVNGNTASAAEMVVGALRDQRKAFVIGTKTFGKGVFEKTFTLANQYRVKFITGAMYTPTGAAWQGKGLAPDFLVDQEPATVTALQKLDLKARLSRDVALITAIRVLNLE